LINLTKRIRSGKRALERTYILAAKTSEELQLTAGIEALDVLGMALIDHGHGWTDYERSLYERATGKPLCRLVSVVTGNRFTKEGKEPKKEFVWDEKPDFLDMD
jgi:hypothetical protein